MNLKAEDWLKNNISQLKKECEDFDDAMFYIRQDMPDELKMDDDDFDWTEIENRAHELW